ncbi:uncharacterized oxidoreductase ZK1290.5-like [Paramacrobiotus metropolitanus]|uniref:uncharacterized oxidoreductase ZK1290.5-like n=1 Tax=Paramacrobiotus metropolitanus TaxID=2943436 RepID=UPI002445AD29|nr:uncharacterized oxidoreductase ZK1290.5-like [Paramacrobiotus metropolitanus]
MEYFSLSNQVRIPKLGLGTSHSGGYSHEAAVYALKTCGYELIDTAKRYGNEGLLSKAIAESQRNREDLFLTSKLWPSDYGKSTTKSALLGSLKRLSVDYLDLYLLHWPLVPGWCSNPKQLLEETWRELELLYDEGLCRAVGVSNYTEDDLIEMMNYASIVPHVNQSEFHVLNRSPSLLQFCQDNDIQFEGYCPLGKGTFIKIPAVNEIAQQYGKTPAQILLRWSIQSGVVTIPKSTNCQRLRENIDVLDFSLADRHMAVLDAMHVGRCLKNREGMQEKLDNDLPDGYKLGL